MKIAKKNKGAKHDQSFKPSDADKSDPIKPLFEHKADHVFTKKNYKDANGKVQAGPKNIITGPAKFGVGASTVGHLFNRTPIWQKK